MGVNVEMGEEGSLNASNFVERNAGEDDLIPTGEDDVAKT